MALATNRQLCAARALVGWGQEDLAAAAKISIGTVRRMESIEGPIRGNTTSLRKVQAALEKAGIEFLNHGSPGVRLKVQET